MEQSYFDRGADIFLDHVGIDISHVILNDSLVEIFHRFKNSTKQTSILHIRCIESEEIVLTRLNEFLLCLVSLFMFFRNTLLPRRLNS